MGQQDPAHPSGPIPLPRQPTWPETPLHWGPPPQPPPPQPPFDPGPPKRGWNTGVVVAVVVVVLLAVGGAGWFIWQRMSTATPTDSATTATDNPASAGSASAGSASAGSASAGSPEAGGKTLQPGEPTTAPGPAPDAEQAALNELTSLRDQSVPQVPLDGRWVAQLSSKSVGITDPLQTAANGTHTFYAADILAELQNINATVGSSATLYLLWGTDFGKRSTAADGSPYWTTLADAGFASQDDVTRWCSATFPGLPADVLADQCTARQLTPPHD
ncbi:hypothetical protein [Petropleomorpha daqingensis]|uniref:Uncharacterized protein n=1 Tax=Petropleomorpha daqingensis TaxID=2026353 RepID=A0A853CDG4_9ACTN|nr:hypothetical protein [Petropleomorpha daqingensis]NYJ05824.1 hypothetical protein [Petropleomorpha daqingensis]